MPEPELEARERLQRLLAARYRLDRELGRGGMATVCAGGGFRHVGEVVTDLRGLQAWRSPSPYHGEGDRG